MKIHEPLPNFEEHVPEYPLYMEVALRGRSRVSVFELGVGKPIQKIDGRSLRGVTSRPPANGGSPGHTAEGG